MATKEDHSWFLPQLSVEERRNFKDSLSHMKGYVKWVRDTGQDIFDPDFVEHGEYLRNVRNLAPTSANAHLYTIYNRYRDLLNDGTLRAALEKMLQKKLGHAKEEDVEKILAKIRAIVASRDAILDAKRPEVEYRRPRVPHIKALLASPDPDKAIGKRDIAIFSIMLTTGLRASEVCALQVQDLYATTPTGPALHVPEGRGCTERIIPYGRLRWGLARVEDWLKGPDAPNNRAIGYFPIEGGPVFRGFYRGGNVPREEGLSARSLDYVFNSYPIDFDGEKTTIRPMELRRAYARLLFEAGFELEAIKERLGVTDNNTLMDYIGGRDANLGLPSDTDILEEGIWFEH